MAACTWWCVARSELVRCCGSVLQVVVGGVKSSGDEWWHRAGVSWRGEEWLKRAGGHAWGRSVASCKLSRRGEE